MQNDIKISRELAKRLIKGDASKGANALQLVDAWKAMDELRALLAAPAVECQEPCEWRYRFTHRGELSKWLPVDGYMKLYAIGNDPAYEVQPLYTSPPAPVVMAPSGGHLRVEVRQCDNCNHVGINDLAIGIGACHNCEWQGVEPADDKCHGCDSTNCMAAACPKCGARYVLLAEENLPDRRTACLGNVKELNQ